MIFRNKDKKNKANELIEEYDINPESEVNIGTENDIDLGNEDLRTYHEYKKVSDSEFDKYMQDNKLYISLFFAAQDRRILFKRNNWKKSFGNIEEYIKYYIMGLSKRLRVPQMALTINELEQKWDISETIVHSYDHTKLKLVTIKSWVEHKANNKKWVIIAHGLNSHKFRAIFFGLIFLRLGYNIVVFDQRNHGESDKAFTTLGEHEKEDLNSIIKYLFRKHKSNIKEINFFGWSMGTFAILEYIKKYHHKIKKVLNWVILDSTVNNLVDLYRYIMKRLRINYYEHFYAIQQHAILKRGYDPLTINPGEGMQKLKNVPIMFVLNKRDRMTPYIMGEEAYQNKIKFEKKHLSELIVYDCDHVRGIYNYTDKYIEEIQRFIRKHSK